VRPIAAYPDSQVMTDRWGMVMSAESLHFPPRRVLVGGRERNGATLHCVGQAATMSLIVVCSVRCRVDEEDDSGSRNGEEETTIRDEARAVSRRTAACIQGSTRRKTMCCDAVEASVSADPSSQDCRLLPPSWRSETISAVGTVVGGVRMCQNIVNFCCRCDGDWSGRTAVGDTETTDKCIIVVL